MPIFLSDTTIHLAIRKQQMRNTPTKRVDNRKGRLENVNHQARLKISLLSCLVLFISPLGFAQTNYWYDFLYEVKSENSEKLTSLLHNYHSSIEIPELIDAAVSNLIFKKATHLISFSSSSSKSLAKFKKRCLLQIGIYILPNCLKILRANTLCWQRNFLFLYKKWFARAYYLVSIGLRSQFLNTLKARSNSEVFLC
jgi:hypothetical protein